MAKNENLDEASEALKRLDDSILEDIVDNPKDVAPLKFKIPTTNAAMQKAKEIRREALPKNFEADADFDYARKNLQHLIEDGVTSLQELMDLARETGQPRVYEVIATLMTTIGNVNKDLVGLHTTKKKLTEKIPDTVQPKADGTVTNNVQNNTVVFTGTTEDLQKIIANMPKAEDIIDGTVDVDQTPKS